MSFSQVVYIVDDSEIDCLIVTKLLHAKFPHIHLELFHSADEALEAIKSQKNGSAMIPSLILLDINMPTKSGWEFLDEFQVLSFSDSRFEPVNVIIFTSSIHPNDPLIAKKYNKVVDFIVKPLRKEDIEEKISIYC
jgi:CheY-like chemotaxis protein